MPDTPHHYFSSMLADIFAVLLLVLRYGLSRVLKAFAAGRVFIRAFFRARISDLLLSPLCIRCPSERASWARLRATLRQPCYHDAHQSRANTPRGQVLRALLHGLQNAARAPQTLYALPHLPGAEIEPLCVPSKALWVLQLDVLRWDYTTLVQVLMFANNPGSTVIVTTRTPADVCSVADKCGFITLTQSTVAQLSTNHNVQDNATVILFIRSRSDPFMHDAGPCHIRRSAGSTAKTPRTSRAASANVSECTWASKSGSDTWDHRSRMSPRTPSRPTPKSLADSCQVDVSPRGLQSWALAPDIQASCCSQPTTPLRSLRRTPKWARTVPTCSYMSTSDNDSIVSKISSS